MTNESLIIALISLVIPFIVAYLTCKWTTIDMQKQIAVNKESSEKEIKQIKQVSLILIDDEIHEIDRQISAHRQHCYEYSKSIELEESKHDYESSHSHWNSDFDQLSRDKDFFKSLKENSNNFLIDQIKMLEDRKIKLSKTRNELINI